MTYILRKALLTDHSTLLDFERGIIEAERPYDPTLQVGSINYYDLIELMHSDDAEVLVVEYNGEAIASGYARIKVAQEYLKHKEYSYLGFMFVKENHRGKGVNKLIIDGLLEWSKRKGLDEIRLQVYDDNESAIKAYEKVGFKKHMIEMRLIKK
jgi:GNAT superfamily N-acetyltransferase